MNQLSGLVALRAFPAKTPIDMGMTIQIPDKGETDLHGLSAILVLKENRIRHLPGIHHAEKSFYYPFISAYLIRCHIFLKVLYSAMDIR